MGCASGLTMRTYGVGADGMIQLDPLDRLAAIQLLEQMTGAWLQGLQSPLPIAIKSAFAWLAKDYPNKQNTAEAKEAARKQYEGDSWNPGEVDYDLYLRRFYPEFEMIEPGFAEWAERLYAPAFTQLKLVKEGK